MLKLQFDSLVTIVGFHSWQCLIFSIFTAPVKIILTNNDKSSVKSLFELLITEN